MKPHVIFFAKCRNICNGINTPCVCRTCGCNDGKRLFMIGNIFFYSCLKLIHIHAETAVCRDDMNLLLAEADDMQSFCHRRMCLIRNINNGTAAFVVGQACISGCGKRCQIGNGTSGDKETSSGSGISGKITHPADQLFFNQIRRRGINLTACMRIVGVCHDIAHPGKERGSGRHTGKAARMLDQKCIGINITEHF